MNSSISALTKKSVEELDDIYGFVAYNNLVYKLYGDSVVNGFTITAELPHLNQSIDQNALRDKLDHYSKTYLRELGFQLSASVFEVWLFDVLRILLINPNRLNKKRKVDVADVISAKSIEDLKRSVIDAELNEIRYKNPAEWFEYLGSFANIGAPSAHDIETVSEIKASRDILTHNNGIANQTYLHKSGSLARVKEGEPIQISTEYFNDSWKHLRKVVETVGNQVADKVSA